MRASGEAVFHECHFLVDMAKFLYNLYRWLYMGIGVPNFVTILHRDSPYPETDFVAILSTIYLDDASLKQHVLALSRLR